MDTPDLRSRFSRTVEGKEASDENMYLLGVPTSAYSRSEEEEEEGCPLLLLWTS